MKRNEREQKISHQCSRDYSLYLIPSAKTLTNECPSQNTRDKHLPKSPSTENSTKFIIEIHSLSRKIDEILNTPEE